MGGRLQTRYDCGVAISSLITSDADVCHGKPRFAGTRIPVSVVLDNMAAGETEQSILESYPSLRSEHLRAAIAYAANLAREPVIALPPRVA